MAPSVRDHARLMGKLQEVAVKYLPHFYAMHNN